jgi:drug/metabolite transporter (DMT)-like permease
MAHGRAINLAMLATAAVVYGGIFPVNRIAAESGWPALGFAFAQAALSGVALACYVLARRRALLPSPRDSAVYLLLGTLAMGLPTALLTWAAQHVPASTLTLVLPLSPVLTLLFAIVLRLERFRARVLAAVLLGLVGVGLIALPGARGLPDGALPWFVLALFAPVSFAASNVATALTRPPAAASSTVAAGILLGGTVVLALALLVSGPRMLPPLLDARGVSALVLASLIDAITFVLFVEIVRRAGATFFSMFNYLVIVAGVAWSMLMFAEIPPPVFWLALAVLLAAITAAVGGRRAAAA